MNRRLRFVFLIGALFLSYNIGLLFAADGEYTYDDLNRLFRVDYGDGSAVEYGYDDAGNRLIRSTTPPNGALTVTISPQGAIDAGAQWKVSGDGVWRASGATVSGLSVGTHTLQFKAVTGYHTPPDQSVAIVGGQTATATGTYMPPGGALTVIIEPAGAVTAGARWRVDGGSWQISGAVVGGLAPGMHAVSFNSVTGYLSPSGFNTAIVDGQTTSETGTYTPQSLVLTYPVGGEVWTVGETRTITWSSAAAGASVKIEISRDGGSSWTNIASSTNNDGSEPWTVSGPATNCRIRVTSIQYPALSSMSANFTIQANVADLSVTMLDVPDPVSVGGTLTYNLTVRNSSGSTATATGVTLTDTFPTTATFVSATPSQGSCGQAGGVVTCNLGSIAIGGSATASIQVSPTQAGTVSNTASVSGTPTDPVPSNNSFPESTQVVTEAADLALTLTDARDPVTVRSTIVYTATVSNAGPSDATGVVLADILPAGVTFISASPGQGSCNESGGVVGCNLGTIAAGAGATVTIQVRAETAGILTSSANVRATEPDPNSANSSASQSTTVIAVSPMVPILPLLLSE